MTIDTPALVASLAGTRPRMAGRQTIRHARQAGLRHVPATLYATFATTPAEARRIAAACANATGERKVTRLRRAAAPHRTPRDDVDDVLDWIHAAAVAVHGMDDPQP